jgi:hypothetical protein
VQKSCEKDGVRLYESRDKIGSAGVECWGTQMRGSERVEADIAYLVCSCVLSGPATFVSCQISYPSMYSNWAESKISES